MWTVTFILNAIILALALISYKKSKSTILKNLLIKLNVILNDKQKIKNNRNEGDKIKEEISPKTVLDIPGPLSLPLIGTKWIYFWRYKMTKIHEAYKGIFA